MGLENKKGLEVKLACELLADSVALPNHEGQIKDAIHNISFGQYDEFVSNLYAGYIKDNVKLDENNKFRLDELVCMMGLEKEIEELKRHLAGTVDTSDGV